MKHLMSMTLILFGFAIEIHGKAGKPCRKDGDCHSGLQFCNRRRLCECFISGRQSPSVYRLYQLCQKDTYGSEIGDRCEYSSQCNQKDADVGCIGGFCDRCKDGYVLASDGKKCRVLITTTSSTPTPLTEEQIRKNDVNKIIVIATATCCSLAGFGVIVAIIRSLCENKGDRRYHDDIYHQDNRINMENEEESFCSTHLDLQEKDAISYDLHFDASAPPVPPEYTESESVPFPKTIEEIPTPVVEKDSSSHDRPEPVSRPIIWVPAPPPGSYNSRWLPSVEDEYDCQNDEPPPYDLNKFIKNY